MIGPGGGAPQRPEDRVSPMNSSLALRVTIVGTVALLMFAVIFLRLWFLQVLTGHQYVAQARSNITRPVSIPATRGRILASDGTSVLVNSVRAPAILIQAQELPVKLDASDPTDLTNPPAADAAVYARLAKVLGLYTNRQSCKFTLTYDNDQNVLIKGRKFDVKLAEIPCILAQHAADITTGTVTVKTNVPVPEQAYISERQPQFPGVEVTQTSISQFPQDELAAQVLGTVGANDDSLTGKPIFTDIPAYDQVGTSGLEQQYNQYLQGKDGEERVEVNAQGDYERTETPVPGTAGDDLKTSISLPLEKVGDQALQQSLTDSGSTYGGAFVAMDPQNGQVYAMGSLPSYNPATLENPDLTPRQYDAEFNNPVTAPLFNRATQGVGLPGSTFKVITGTAALESGAFSPGQTIDDTGTLTVSGESFSNSPGDPALGSIGMQKAIQFSDDVFFYTLGERMNPDPFTQPQGTALQKWARKYGINQRPAIDLPDASSGTIPSPAVVNELITEERQCATATGSYSYTNGTNVSSKPHGAGWHRSPKHPDGCGIADPSTVGWTVGDNIQAAIGQNGVSASPLEMAMVYSAVENGGTLVTPHIGQDIQTPTGQVVQNIDPKPERKLDIDPSYLSIIQQGLEQAANDPGGTSYDVMHGFGKTVYGKTGTADYKPTTGPDAGVDTPYAWYDCYVPSSETNKPIEITVWVEAGGYGDQTAAPVAKEMLSQWFYGHAGSYDRGSSTDQ